MLNTKGETKSRRLAERPRMNVHETGDGESWRCTATMWSEDVERLAGVEPTAPCERGEPHGCPSYWRRRCDACVGAREWVETVLSIVQRETGWRLYSFQRGPGQAFASEPIVYSPRKHPTLTIVSWNGGLDI